MGSILWCSLNSNFWRSETLFSLVHLLIASIPMPSIICVLWKNDQFFLTLLKNLYDEHSFPKSLSIISKNLPTEISCCSSDLFFFFWWVTLSSFFLIKFTRKKKNLRKKLSPVWENAVFTRTIFKCTYKFLPNLSTAALKLKLGNEKFITTKTFISTNLKEWKNENKISKIKKKFLFIF